MNDKLNRREFIAGSVAGMAGLAWGCSGAGSAPAGRVGEPVSLGRPDAGVATLASRAEKAFRSASDRELPLIEVAGSPREIGRAIGKRFGREIKTGLERRAEWFSELEEYAAGEEGRSAMEDFRAAARKHTPRAVEELEGWAEGAGIEAERLWVLNLKAEIRALIDRREEKEGKGGQPGCSTVVVAEPGRVRHLHNEDGHEAYADSMFLVRARPTDGAEYFCLSYPGILPGNAPAINEHGVVQTTNFIYTKEVRRGVGRYFLDRMILESRDLAEALEWSSHPERAYAFHHVLTSVPEKRAVGIEVTPSKKKVHEIDGLYLHTNHLVLEGMADEEQDPDYVGSSSSSRWKVLEKWAAGADDPAALSDEELLAPLASHESAPYSPCRHPAGDVEGFTLATAFFEAPSGSLRLYKGQPCRGIHAEYRAFPH
ncbi:MAG: C45 family peptidase [Polyangia bacterium]